MKRYRVQPSCVVCALVKISSRLIHSPVRLFRHDPTFTLRGGGPGSRAPPKACCCGGPFGAIAEGRLRPWATSVPGRLQPVGFQNSAAAPDLAFYAARSYSLMRPPRTV